MTQAPFDRSITWPGRRLSAVLLSVSGRDRPGEKTSRDRDKLGIGIGIWDMGYGRDMDMDRDRGVQGQGRCCWPYINCKSVQRALPAAFMQMFFLSMYRVKYKSTESPPHRCSG